MLGRGAVCINTGGEKVYPEEVEAVLKAHPAVYDAVVAGVPTSASASGSLPSSSCGRTTKADEAELIAHARAHVAGYKAPRMVVLVPEIRRSPSGKADYPWAAQDRRRGCLAATDDGELSVSGEAATAAGSIPASQPARRERILDAAMELATDGGWDAVQMREVAERAEVALGTLYRYFPSKVHLLVSVLGRTFTELHESVQVDGADGTPQERVYRVVAVMTRYLARHRRLSGAMVRALMTRRRRGCAGRRGGR